MKTTIIGDGGWGTALGLLLRQNGHDVTIWGPFPDYLAEVRARRENTRYLPGIAIPPEIIWTADTAEATRDAQAFVLAVPSKFYADVCRKFQGQIAAATPVISVTKGLCATTHHRMSEIAADILGHKDIAVLSGPSHAEEVARGLPTAVVAAAREQVQAGFFQRLFTGPRFRVYTSRDPVGVELGGAVKNVIAIAVGVSDGLGFGDNTRAALITRGLAEMTRLAIARGALPETLAGLSGIGDLIVTCTSRHSRNRGVGERLGRGETIDQILSGMQMVAEGVWNSRIVRSLAHECDIEMPITEQVHGFCYEKLDPQQALVTLMTRDSKPE
ncbi:MAG: NAD(P)H-dependent glycerol-3-phosphate dehydrogenase [bacterium]